MHDTGPNRVIRPRSIRSGIGTSAKHALLALSLGLMACGTSHQGAQAQAQSAGLTCRSALDQLMSEWQSVGFAEPSKPAQMIVAGRHGYSTTGGQFNYMRTQIRMAARDCVDGRDDESLGHIRTVRELLDHDHHI
jgi:hypothetical protein